MDEENNQEENQKNPTAADGNPHNGDGIFFRLSFQLLLHDFFHRLLGLGGARLGSIFLRRSGCRHIF